MKKTILLLPVLILLLCISLSLNTYATKWIITAQNFAFSPSSLPSVHLGDTISWVWISGSHTTTSLTIPPAAPTWDHSLNVSNPLFEYVPTIVGTYNYKCTPHYPTMVGSFLVSPPPSVSFNLKVLLEGAFDGNSMNTKLNLTGKIPLSQPYNNLPWNYPGLENVPSIPNADIVDWMLVELRETTGDASTATPNKIINRQAAFLKNNGEIVGLNGSSLITYVGTITNNLYIVLWHRNHIGIMSSTSITPISGIYTWDFSLSDTQVYGGSAGYKVLPGGLWSMAAGDGDHNGLINLTDYNIWTSSAGYQGYLNADYSMESQVNNTDKNDKWNTNTSKSDQVPD